MAKLPDLLRVVEIEHQGETIRLEVHIQLTPQEIQRVLVSAEFQALFSAHIRRSSQARGIL